MPATRERAASASLRPRPSWPEATSPKEQPPETWPRLQPILTLQDGLELRPWRSSDTPALERLLTPATTSMYPDDTFPYPWNFLGAFNYISRSLSEEKLIKSNPVEVSESSQALPHSTRSPTLAKCQSIVDHTGSTSYLFPIDLAITLNDQVIGNMGMSAPRHGSLSRTAEVDYWLGEDYWGRGITTACVRACVCALAVADVPPRRAHRSRRLRELEPRERARASKVRV